MNRKNCYVCAEELDRDRALCAKCSKANSRQRRSAVLARLSALSASHSDSAALRERLDSAASPLCTAVEPSTALRAQCERAAARVAELRAAIASLRAQTDAARRTSRQRREFLALRRAALDKSVASLDVTRVRISAMLAAARGASKATLAKEQEGLAAWRRSAVAELVSFLPIGPSPRAPGSESVVVNVRLPNSGNYKELSPAVLTAALGHAATIVRLISRYTGVPLPFVFRSGPRPSIRRASEEAQYPLYFERTLEEDVPPGVALLNEAVVALCIANGVGPHDTNYPAPANQVAQQLPYYAAPTVLEFAPADIRRTAPNLLRLLRSLLVWKQS
eukprot:m51a1_g9526 hypothetical protein (334) ;mRNA; r:764079-765297